MLRSKLVKRFLKDRTDKIKIVCLYLFKKAKKEYYENIDASNLTDSNRFCKMVNPIFGSKIQSENSIILVESKKIILKGGELAKIINENLLCQYCKNSWNK